MFTWLRKQIQLQVRGFLEKYSPEHRQQYFPTEEEMFLRDFKGMVVEGGVSEQSVERVAQCFRRQASHDALLLSNWYLAGGRVKEKYGSMPFISSDHDLYQLIDTMERAGLQFMDVVTAVTFLRELEGMLDVVQNAPGGDRQQVRLDAIRQLGDSLKPLDEDIRAEALDRPRHLVAGLRNFYQVGFTMSRPVEADMDPDPSFPNFINLPIEEKSTPARS